MIYGTESEDLWYSQLTPMFYLQLLHWYYSWDFLSGGRIKETQSIFIFSLCR